VHKDLPMARSAVEPRVARELTAPATRQADIGGGLADVTGGDSSATMRSRAGEADIVHSLHKSVT
jgi:hypothetical protein